MRHIVNMTVERHRVKHMIINCYHFIDNDQGWLFLMILVCNVQTKNVSLGLKAWKSGFRKRSVIEVQGPENCLKRGVHKVQRQIFWNIRYNPKNGLYFCFNTDLLWQSYTKLLQKYYKRLAYEKCFLHFKSELK